MEISLRAARVNLKLSQKESAKHLGISVYTLSNYERGKSFPNVPILKKIENLYGVKYEDVIFLP